MCHGREVGGREPGRELGSKARRTGLWAVCAHAARSVREGRKAGGRGRGGAALGERTRSRGGAMSSALVLFSAVDMALSDPILPPPRVPWAVALLLACALQPTHSPHSQCHPHRLCGPYLLSGYQLAYTVRKLEAQRRQGTSLRSHSKLEKKPRFLSLDIGAQSLGSSNSQSINCETGRPALTFQETPRTQT